MTAPALRPYQAAAVAAIRERYARGERATLVTLATGTGKTVIFAEVARLVVARGGRVLVAAHRAELLAQAIGKLEAVGVAAGLEQGARRAGSASVVVASVQTLKGARLASWPRDAFDLVVIDEAHHAPAAGYQAIVDHFARARVLGVTATPDRADGRAMGEVFQSAAYRYDLRQAIRDGWLAPLVARRVVVEHVDLSAVHTRAGDLDPAELAAAMAAEGALHGVVRPLVDLAGDRRTIVFACNVGHARALADVANRYRPGWARAIDGTASTTERAQVLADFRAGRIGALINCSLFTEGFDEPAVACVAVARPTKSRPLYAQMVGRGTRIAPGKRDCLVVDFTGNAGRHRLASPLDVLAGAEVPPEVLALAGDRLDAGADLDAVLSDAQTEAAARIAEAAATAVVRYQAEHLDPFLGDLPELPPHAAEWSTYPATPRQVAALEAAGFKSLPAELTKADASRWLDALERRRHARLPTYKQARVLMRHGVPLDGVDFDRATELIDNLKRRWRHAS